MRVLTVNAGSSSLKLDVVEDGRRVARAALPGAAGAAAVEHALTRLEPVEAVGHRIVHGGPRFSGPVRVDDEVVDALAELTALAPLHQIRSLAVLELVGARLPDVPAVACFDTAFHADLPAAAQTFALPLAWRERWGLRRYGFHGLAHASAARSAAALLGRPASGLRIVTCHLGGGASLAAVLGGRSVDTTMGFTPLDGLVMATRAGAVDPGLLLWLLEQTGLGEHEMAHALEHDSGLLALAGAADMQRVVDLVFRGDARARLGLEVYLHRLRAGIASMAAAMDGLDVLVFSGGVGENAPTVRAQACWGLGFLGVRLDAHANAAGTGDRDVSTPGAAVHTLVVGAHEELEIARQVVAVLAGSAVR